MGTKVPLTCAGESPAPRLQSSRPRLRPHLDDQAERIGDRLDVGEVAAVAGEDRLDAAERDAADLGHLVGSAAAQPLGSGIGHRGLLDGGLDTGEAATGRHPGDYLNFGS